MKMQLLNLFFLPFNQTLQDSSDKNVAPLVLLIKIYSSVMCSDER